MKGTVAKVGTAPAPAERPSRLALRTCFSLNLNRRLTYKAASLRTVLAAHQWPDVVLLQEVGAFGDNPARALEVSLPEYKAFQSATLRRAQDPLLSRFQVSLVTLVRQELVPVVTQVLRSPTKSVLAVLFGDFAVLNAYMPAGLDSVPMASSQVETADHVWLIHDWISQLCHSHIVSHWILGADFNETTCDDDSTSTGLHPRRRRSTPFLASLLGRIGGEDLSGVQNNMQHTFFRPSPSGISSSKLDRIVASPAIAQQLDSYRVLDNVQVSPTLPLSDHRAVLVCFAPFLLQHPWGANEAWRQRKFIVPQGPGTLDKRREACEKANALFDKKFSWLSLLLGQATTDAQLEHASTLFANALTTIATKTFRMTNPLSMRRKNRTRRLRRLGDLRSSLAKLKWALQDDSKDRDLLAPSISTLHKRLRSTGSGNTGLSVTPVCQLFSSADWVGSETWRAAASQWTQAHLSSIRAQIKTERRVRSVDWDSFCNNPHGAAAFSKKFAKLARPPPMRQVPSPDGPGLTDDPDTVKEVLLARVTAPMCSPLGTPKRLNAERTAIEDGLPDWASYIYAPAEHIDPKWWDSLLPAPTWPELREVIVNAKKHTSPGEGALGIDVIQCLLDWQVPFLSRPEQPPSPIGLAMLAYLAAVLRVGLFPRHLCCAWITTIGKGKADPLDVRPISVLPELYRLVSRVLGARFKRILLKFPILHPSQRAGLSDADFLQALDAAANMMEDARTNPLTKLAMIFYDQSKAFDLIDAVAMRRALVRLKLPEIFISLILSSMARALAKIRTFHGLSRSRALTKSLRQGDPLATLLYCFFIDPLHTMLGRMGGHIMESGTTWASLGFVDDSAVSGQCFQHLELLHAVVIDFNLMNCTRTNGSKSHLFLFDHKGPLESRCLVSEDGTIIRPELPQTEVRYLGVWFNIEGSWRMVDQKINKIFWGAFNVIEANNMTVKAAAMVVNNYLIPSLSRFLRMIRSVIDPKLVKALRRKQAILNRMVARKNGLPLPALWGGKITPLLFGFKDMAEHAITLNLEVLHIRLNADPRSSVAAASSHDRLFSDVCPSLPNPNSVNDLLTTPLRRLAALTLTGRSVSLLSPGACSTTLSRFQLAQTHHLTWLPNSRHMRAPSMEILPYSDRSLFLAAHQGAPRHPTLSLITMATAPSFQQVIPESFQIDAYSLNWNSGLVAPSALASRSLIAYTDGSAKAGEDSAAGAAWFSPDIGAFVLYLSARLRPSRHSYFGECVGILIVLRFTPLDCDLEIVCDCDSALFTAVKPTDTISARRRAMAAARPVLECIRAILRARTAGDQHYMEADCVSH
jgi:exonuclease III